MTRNATWKCYKRQRDSIDVALVVDVAAESGARIARCRVRGFCGPRGMECFA